LWLGLWGITIWSMLTKPNNSLISIPNGRWQFVQSPST
ncbi:ABC transporter family protein, partial [Vibrio parahaemolyticus VPTS-2010]